MASVAVQVVEKHGVDVKQLLDKRGDFRIMSSILGLREFAHMRWDPRILIVDARERATARGAALDNPFFPWIRIAPSSDLRRLATDVLGRHLVIVAEDEERALDLNHVFETLEVDSWALEGGERGWRQAIVEEQCDSFGDAIVVVMNRLAVDRRLYLIVRGTNAVVVQPSGSIAAIREEARHQGALIEAVVDVLPTTSDAGLRLAKAVGARYYAPGVSELDTSLALHGATIEPAEDGALRLRGSGFTIGPTESDNYRIR